MKKITIELVYNEEGEAILPLPDDLIKNYNLQVGDSLQIEPIENGKYLLKPIIKGANLNDLLNGINKDNLHGETDFGDPVGGEVI